MKNLASISRTLFISALALLCAFASTDNAQAAKKPKTPKGIVLVEGDNAVLTVGDKYTTIEFPENLTAEDFDLYSSDLVNYLMDSNAKISNDGTEYANYSVYYYMHNSREWMHKGQYNNPAQITVSKIKKISISNRGMRLREFYKEMPLLSNSQEKKADQSFQDETRSGEKFYTYIEVFLRD